MAADCDTSLQISAKYSQVTGPLENSKKAGGNIAGDARKSLEKKSGEKVVTARKPLDDNLLS